ncbi:hybrid sensor histidine kinase/response regulator [Helicobacter pullorum]|uniref:histidine kinase n=1 Tax=Helicobacter pullorum MIT 98-5489 TaxID=537972 RepID=C5EY79_9HELI|nr:chemotaxis protein CheW [Helicobacter pullorum]EEQ62849.1 response regulator receiver domain protein [Helicobacter pullorum MIT 98-5489]KPH54459.1 chemotaxis protein CheA [Helicobacter pullorum]OCR05115.1 chemotaxis protein CheA [Helicobacter pullorum]OCR06957.1 chemotaxis protein CheA [Helicobacter pullorum]OCR11075.1 chemotaxis protein CheA [Helicobacter pullorum]
MDEMQEILEDFLIEAFEMIEQLDQDLVELENRPEDLELLNRIFRVAHTIKGSGSFLNFSVLTHLTHHMEDVLNKARHGELTITPDIMDVVLESIDFMKKLLNAIRDTGTDANTGLDSDIANVVARLDAISKGESPQDIPASQESSTTQEAPQSQAPQEASNNAQEEVDYSNMSPEEVEKEIERLLNQRQEEDKKKREEKRAKGELQDIQAPSEIEQTPNATPAAKAPESQKQPEVNATPAKQTEAKPQIKPRQEENKTLATSVEQTIRVDVKRLDSLMNLIGELVLGKNRLIKIYNDVEERYEGEKFLEELNQVVASVSMVTTDIQLAVMKTRMLPIGRVFNKFPRMVRDLSRELGKNIELVISGEETELDKSIVEEIGDPLVHLIRNACDHGIESKEERIAAGKKEQGTVELKAYNEGNHIVVEITDDGKGMDPATLKAKAIEKGIIGEREADTMTDREAYSLIFKAGFSTAKVVTNVSGRGVGMDVVKTNIEKLNGIIDVDSTYGEGTTLKLKIPLTLAIIQSLLVGVQEEYYAIPLASVIETVRISQDEIYTVENKSVLRLRNEVLPLVRLADIFGVDSVFDNSEQAYVVVIGLAENKIGVIVDFLIGQEEVVIKSLGSYLKGTEGIAGATIRGDGRVTLIVDIAAMMQMAKQVKVSVTKLAQENEKKKEKNSPSDYNVLIVDDSMTDRAIMKKSLKPLGISVSEATNGMEALDIVKNGDKAFDAILIDIEMPKMDGYTLAGEIRKYAKFKNLPLIAVTSRTSKTDRMRGVESGMTEYITKPYSPEYLMNVVKRNINLTMEVTE